MVNLIRDSFYSQIKNIVSEYVTDNIIIIGKGASIDNVDLNMLAGNFTININDSEKLFAGDICLFHRDFVLESIKERGFSCKLYLTDNNQIKNYTTRYLMFDFVPFREETADLILYRFLESKIFLEEILFVTAIKICQVIAQIKGKKQKIYMLGFDFNAEVKVYSDFLKHDYSGDDSSFKKAFIRSQELYLIEIMSLLSEPKMKNIEVIHVGKKPYSGLSPEQFNQLFRHSNISKITVKALSSTEGFATGETRRECNEESVIIVAEFTNNHLGNIDTLQEMVRLAKKAGADFIKVQKRDVDNFYTKAQLNSYYDSPFGKTLGDYRRGVELTNAGFEALKEECTRCNIKWFSTVLDYNSFRFIKDLGCDIIKIPSTVSEGKDFHNRIANEHHGPIVVSTGFTLPDYEEYIANLFVKNEKLYLLHTVSAYPTPPHECSISVIRHYRDLSFRKSNIIPGYSSHDIGSLGSILAVAAGAKMIEKHVKIGNKAWIHFDHVALDLSNNEFGSFVKDIRLAEMMCGNEQKTIGKSENHKYWYSGPG